MKTKSLVQIYADHEGKVSDKWSLYLTEYERIFSEYRHKPIRLFEVGIQNGGSLDIWAKYFLNGEKFIGCDINSECNILRYSDQRIAFVIGDATAKSMLKEILKHSPEFDIVIDDGSHMSSDIIKVFARYFPIINNGGVYVVEDLHCSYWEEFEGGLFAPFSSVTFFKHLADIINHEHWGVEKKRTDLLKGFNSKYGIKLNETILEQVHSVEFINSMCVVRKSMRQNNLLGRRFVGGTIEKIASGHTEIIGSCLNLSSQTQNCWSTKEITPYEELPIRLKELADRNSQNEELKLLVADHNSQIETLKLGIGNRDNQVEVLSQKVAELNSKISKIICSKSWRATHAFRVIGRFFRKNLAIIGKPKYFNTDWYLMKNPDVASAGMNPYKHYIAFGKAEGRQPNPHLSNPRLNYNLVKSICREISTLIKDKGGILTMCKRTVAIWKREGLVGVKQRVMHLQWPGMKSIGCDRNNYTRWIRLYDDLTKIDKKRIVEQIKSFKRKPLISVIMPVFNPPKNFLEEAIKSVQSQLYPNWELCIADDASHDPSIRALLEKYSKEDNRIKVVFRPENGHISKASNSALELATGQYSALLDHDDIIPEHALYWVVNEINNYPDVKLIYSDEDKVDEKRQRYDAYFKCDWNPDLILSQNMFCHLGVYRTDLIRKISGFRAGFEGAQDYDLVLRCLDNIDKNQIRHIPKVLYHWRAIKGSTAKEVGEKDYAKSAGERAINEYLERNSISAIAESVRAGYRVKYKLSKPYPLVSLIIPTRNMVKLLRKCIDSIQNKTQYPNYEIIIIDNGSDDPETLSYLRKIKKDPHIKIIRDDCHFNYSALNNMAVESAGGEIIGLINNDIEVITPGWLMEMVSHACRPEVGAVGALLLYPDNRIQHAGVILGLGGVAGHANKCSMYGDPGFFYRSSLIQSFSAVTGACLFVGKSKYEEVGGMNEDDLSIAFNDIDFCLKLRGKGYRNIWTPYAELYHHESVSRGLDETPEKVERFNAEIMYMKQQWGDNLLNDPAYSPNLTLDYEDFSLAWPPRITGIDGCVHHE